MVYDVLCFYYLVGVSFLNAIFSVARVYFCADMCQNIDCFVGFEGVLATLFVFHIHSVGA